MSRWFKFPKASRVGCRLNRSSRRCIPIRLEALEDRLAPAVFNVTTLADGGPGSGSLRAAILQSNATPGPNTINLTTPGPYQLSQFNDLSNNGTTGALQITNQSVTIANASGGPAIIDGGGVDRVFDIEGTIPGGVIFTGLTITGGLAGPNGNVGSDLNGSSRDGGAIYSPNTDVTLISCTVANNQAGFEAGGIWTDTGSVFLNGCTVSGNDAGDSGGGIDSFAGGVSVINSSVTGNVSSVGGGICTQKGIITVMGSDISGNSASMNGGGIAMDQGSTGNLTISNSTTITDNVAGEDGGGVWQDSTSGQTALTSSSTIGGNSAGVSGAGIFTRSSTVTVTASTIRDNSAGADGAGLDIGCTTLNITNSSINNNRSSISVSTIGGGGINAEFITGTFTNVNVIGNHSASDGGGIELFSSATVSMTNCNISDNFANSTGGIDVNGGVATFTDCTINGNHASGRVGGMQFAGAELEMTSCTISDNTTGDEAGGLLLRGASAFELIQNSTISNNRAAGNGGGIEVDHAVNTGPFLLNDSTIDGNRAGAQGGGIRDGSQGTGGVLTLQNDTVSGNSASDAGGGIAFVPQANDTDTLDFVTIAGNSAFAGGGAIAFNGTVNVQTTIIAGNHSAISRGPDVAGNSFVTQGSNLIGVEDATSTNFSNGFNLDQVGTPASPINPLLGPVENNGGPTFTMLLGLTGPGLNQFHGSQGKDQRGFARPGVGQDGAAIGALEPQQPSFLGNFANGAYVENLFETLLGRTADPGAAGFVTMLNNGASPATVVADIVHSTEYATDEVRALYATYLHRAADPGGLQHFVGVLTSGGTIEQVEEAIVSSGEYFQLHGGSFHAFLTALYYDALGRGGSPAEQAGFLQGLKAGTFTRAQVATAIFGSAEYQQDLVELYYQEFLGRNADPGGLAAWEAQLKSGMTDAQLVAALLGSGEGFAKRS
jgi:hypothetical protein